MSKYTIELSPLELQFVVNVLQEQPFKLVAQLLAKLQEQAKAQEEQAK